MSRDDETKDRDDEESAEAEAEGAEAEKAEASDDDGADRSVDRDASTQGIADAMGIDAEEGAPAEGEAEGEAEAAGPANRAARRRDQATQRRKKKKKPAAETASESDDAVPALDPDLPKDKNARAKELLKRRQQAAASATRGGGPSGLDTGEMVQDALARGSSATVGFLKKNVRIVAGALVVGALVAGGVVFFKDRKAQQAGNATGALADALASDRGRVIKEDKRSDDEKQADPTRVYATSDARAQAAIEGYDKAVASTSEPGPNTLARLGLAGAKLEKGDLQAAIDGYKSVLDSPLAAADLDVKGRAVEGTGLALEQKGDLDGALKSYDELAKIDAKGFEELGLYHQARVYAHKGDKEKAKALLKKAREKLQAPGETGPFPFLEAVVDGDLRSLDPSAVPAARVQMGGAKGSSMSPEDMDRIQEQLRKLMEKKEGAGHGHEGEGEGEAPPNPFGMPKQDEPQ